MWSLHGSVEQNFVRALWVTWPGWPPHLYMVKTLQKSSSPERKGQWSWTLVCSKGPWAHQSLFKWWPWVDLDLFYGKVKFGPVCVCMGKTVRKSYNGRNLQQMTRVTWGICLHKNSDPRGLSVPDPGLYTCIKTWKIMYKIRVKDIFLQQIGKVTRLFCWHQDFVHKGLSALPRGYIHKIRIQRDLFETCNKWSKW